MGATKRCSRCHQELPLEAFNKNKAKKDGRTYACRDCRNRRIRERRAGSADVRERQNKRQAGYYAKNPEKRRAHFLQWKYGLTPEQHKQMYIDQNGCCALCGEPVAYYKILVDHDHATDRIRGLLCRKCNSGLGALGDSVEGLQNAIKYLKE